jgi:hypothetical protein
LVFVVDLWAWPPWPFMICETWLISVFPKVPIHFRLLHTVTGRAPLSSTVTYWETVTLSPCTAVPYNSVPNDSFLPGPSSATLQIKCLQKRDIGLEHLIAFGSSLTSFWYQEEARSQQRSHLPRWWGPAFQKWRDSVSQSHGALSYSEGVPIYYTRLWSLMDFCENFERSPWPLTYCHFQIQWQSWPAPLVGSSRLWWYPGCQPRYTANWKFPPWRLYLLSSSTCCSHHCDFRLVCCVYTDSHVSTSPLPSSPTAPLLTHGDHLRATTLRSFGMLLWTSCGLLHTVSLTIHYLVGALYGCLHWAVLS